MKTLNGPRVRRISLLCWMETSTRYP